MNPAPGWYPDPRPGHTNLQAYWDGQQWHLGATKLTESAERVYWIIGIVAGLALSTVFPPAHRPSGISGRGRHDERSQPRRRARRNWLQASSSFAASALACASSCALNFSASCATSAGVKGAAFLASAESKTALSGTACGFAERWKVAQTIT